MSLLVPGTWEKFSKKHRAICFPHWLFVTQSQVHSSFVFHPVPSFDLFLKRLPATRAILSLASCRATGWRRWWPVPGTDRHTSLITTARLSASKWTRMSEPSVQVSSRPAAPSHTCLPLVSTLSVSPNVSLH